MADSTYNLTALSERLFAEGRLQPLAGKIRRAQELSSLHADLTMALESLDALDVLLAGAPCDDLGRAVTELALLNNAVVLYSRATKTTSDERKGFDPCSRFSAEEAAAHQELVDLRDKAIAHFGSGGRYRGTWQAEVMILQASAGIVRPAVTTRRQTMDKKLVARARKQIRTAHALFHALSQEKIGEVTAELNKMEPDAFEQEVLRHRFNLDIFMASPDAADAARASAEHGGYIKGIVRHGG